MVMENHLEINMATKSATVESTMAKLEEAKKQIKYLKSLVSKRNGVIKYGS